MPLSKLDKNISVPIKVIAYLWKKKPEAWLDVRTNSELVRRWLEVCVKTVKDQDEPTDPQEAGDSPEPEELAPTLPLEPVTVYSEIVAPTKSTNTNPYAGM